MTLTVQEYDYIESQLLAPANGAVQAIEALQACGMIREAQAMVDALDSFMQVCRAVRLEVRRQT